MPDSPVMHADLNGVQPTDEGQVLLISMQTTSGSGLQAWSY